MKKPKQVPLLPFIESEPKSSKDGKGKKAGGQSSFIPRLSNGMDLMETISGLQKYIRRGEEEKALSLAFTLLPEFPHVLFRRLIVSGSEDIGNANPQAAILASAIYQSWLNLKQRQSEFLGRVLLAQLVIYLCRSPKSRETDHACILLGTKLVKGDLKIELDDFVFDKHTKKGRTMGRGMKHFLEEGAKLVNEVGKDRYRLQLIEYLKSLGEYK